MKPKFRKWFEAQFGPWPNKLYPSSSAIRDKLVVAKGVYDGLLNAYEQAVDYEKNERAALYAWQARESSPITPKNRRSAKL